MKIVETVRAMQEQARAWRQAGRRIVLVPTMGCLHAGHASLMRIARQHGDAVVASIFVNPTQFGPKEDFARYPRDFARDEALCRAAGVDAVFYPAAAGMYAPDASVFVTEERLSTGLCGASRPGHFRGVCTVVAKLFNIVLPDAAVFGEKDAQQLRVIRRMVRDLDFPVEIVAGPTVREPDGLAMSSRNAYLPPEERRQAPCLHQALRRAEELYRGGERNAAALIAAMRAAIGRHPAMRVDYLAVVDNETLEPVTRIARPALVALAVFAGATRLIDNVTLDNATPGSAGQGG